MPIDILTSAQIRNVREWIDALRSGRYRQVSDELFGYPSVGHLAHCCLGVACRLHGGRLFDGESGPEIRSNGDLLSDGNAFPLPEFMEQKFGMGEEGSSILADLNDGDLTYTALQMLGFLHDDDDKDTATRKMRERLRMRRRRGKIGYNFRSIANVIEYMYRSHLFRDHEDRAGRGRV